MRLKGCPGGVLLPGSCWWKSRPKLPQQSLSASHTRLRTHYAHEAAVAAQSGKLGAADDACQREMQERAAYRSPHAAPQIHTCVCVLLHDKYSY